MPRVKQKQEQETENIAEPLHPCWGCGHEMNLHEHGVAQVCFVCPNCGEESHKWFYAKQADAERKARCDGTSKWNEGDKQ